MTELESPDELQPPCIAGLNLRNPRGKEDAAGMADVIARSRLADDVDFATTADDLAADFENPSGCDPFNDILIAEIDGRMVGTARIYIETRKNEIAYRHSVELVPEWRGTGLREYLFDWNEKHIRTMVESTNDRRPHIFELWANEADNDWRAIVMGKGYRVVHHEIDMSRDLEDIPSVPLPEGFELRPVRPEHYRAIWEANKNAWRDVWDYAEEKWDDESLAKFLASSHFCPDLWQVAWKGDVLAGMVLNYVVEEENRTLNRKQGHTEYVYVKEEFRGKGLAKALLSRSLQVLKDIGMERATLGTEVDNPHEAMKIYERLGFKLVKQFAWYQKPVFPHS